MRLRLLALLCAATAAFAQAPPPVGAGTFPPTWITGGPHCRTVPAWQIHEYNANLYILRESGCTNYEKPFLYLFFGSERALLIDTGAGASDAAAVTQKLIAGWLVKNKRTSIPLVVAHTHAHGDHTAGDKGFDGMANTTLIAATVEAEQKAFGIEKWPEQAASISAAASSTCSRSLAISPRTSRITIARPAFCTPATTSTPAASTSPISRRTWPARAASSTSLRRAPCPTSSAVTSSSRRRPSWITW